MVVRIITSLPGLTTAPKTFEAFAWSRKSDPAPGNNYREATVTPRSSLAASALTLLIRV
jgi:hypothetical protein